MAFRMILYDKRKEKKKKILILVLLSKAKYEMYEREKTSDTHKLFHYAIIF